MGPSPASRSLIRFLVCVSVLWASVPAFAEETSAADKATARDVATQGIQKYRDGQYAEALDLLKRAQALYDAPVHLQYIARSERELGHWVEAAEAFRALSKRTLDAGAPEQWVAAVEDARGELEALEPKIPRLAIVVRPADAKVTRLTIDGQEVPVAVIGIERVVNPGDHAIAVEAEGFPNAETHAEARESESTKVEVVLAAQTVAPVPVPAAKDTAPDEKKKEKAKSRHYDAMLGLRLGLVAPGGRVPTRFARPAQEDGDIAIDEVAGNGGGLELRAGITGPLSTGFLERFVALIFVSGGSLAGKQLELPDAPALLSLRSDGIDIQATPSFLSGGVALGIGHARDHFGGFAELGVLAYAMTLEYETTNPVPMCAAVARATRTGSGVGARLSAGLGFPIARWGMLTPYLTLGFEQMSTLGFKPDDCFSSWYQEHDVALPPTTESVESAMHSMFGIGLGGEVFLGL